MVVCEFAHIFAYVFASKTHPSRRTRRKRPCIIYMYSFKILLLIFFRPENRIFSTRLVHEDEYDICIYLRISSQSFLWRCGYSQSRFSTPGKYYDIIRRNAFDHRPVKGLSKRRYLRIYIYIYIISEQSAKLFEKVSNVSLISRA